MMNTEACPHKVTRFQRKSKIYFRQPGKKIKSPKMGKGIMLHAALSTQHSLPGGSAAMLRKAQGMHT